MTRKLFHKIEGSGTPLLLIHGFTGSHKSFDKISNFLKIYFKVITIDMIGHGKSMDYKKENYSFDQSIQDISSILESQSLKKINILGYSLGGRLAMQFVNKNPNKINKLIICSASNGIKNKKERENRIISDSKIINLLENYPLDHFVNYWQNLKLWQSEKRLDIKKIIQLRKIRLTQNKIGLALSLSNQGQGVQEYLGDQLRSIKANTLIMFGEKDKKYKEISKEIHNLIENSKLEMVPNSGHNIILENPIFISQKVKHFILGENNENKLAI